MAAAVFSMFTIQLLRSRFVKLNAEIAEIVAREQLLRDEIDRIIAEIEVGV